MSATVAFTLIASTAAAVLSTTGLGPTMVESVWRKGRARRGVSVEENAPLFPWRAYRHVQTIALFLHKGGHLLVILAAGF